MWRLRPPGIEMNLQIRPKLFLPLALLAAPNAPAPNGRRACAHAPRKEDLRRLVATMVD